MKTVTLAQLTAASVAGGVFDAADWNPNEKKPAHGNSGRADAMRNTDLH